MNDITLDELLSEYDRLGLTQDDEGLTVCELSKRWRLCDEAVRRRLRVAQDAGILVVGRKTAPRLDGRMTRVPCYRINRPSKKKK